MGLPTHKHPLQHVMETDPMTLPEAVSFSLTRLLVSVPNHLPSRCTCESTPSTWLLADIRASNYIASNERWPSPTSEYSPRVTALGSPRTASTSPATTAATAANPPSRRSQHCAAHSIAPLRIISLVHNRMHVKQPPYRRCCVSAIQRLAEQPNAQHYAAYSMVLLTHKRP